MTRGSELKFPSNFPEAASLSVDKVRQIGSRVLMREEDPLLSMKREHKMGMQIYRRLEELVGHGVEAALIHRLSPQHDGSFRGRVLDKITGRKPPYITTIVFPQINEQDGSRSFLIIQGWNETTGDTDSVSRYLETVTRVNSKGISRTKAYSNLTNDEGDGTTHEQAINGQPVIPANSTSLGVLLEALDEGGGGLGVVSNPGEISSYTTMTLKTRQIAYAPIGIETDMTWHNKLEV